VINLKLSKKRSLKELKIGQKIAMFKDYRCSLCSLRVDIEEFRNQVFFREFRISGLCQGCQDLVFGYNVAW
jgi:hypothetical protein